MKHIEPTAACVVVKKLLNISHISQRKLASLIRVSPNTINELVNGKRKLTTDVALRLSILFNVNAEALLLIQIINDIEKKKYVNKYMYDWITKTRKQNMCNVEKTKKEGISGITSKGDLRWASFLMQND